MPDHAPAPGAVDPLDLHGVVPPTITAFHADESINHDATAAHARFVVDAGVHGIFPLGTNGEFALLAPEERTAVIETVVDAVDGAVPVIAGVGAPGTRETIRAADHAVAAGVDGIVVVTPYYYPIDPEAAITHYRRITQHVDCPVYVYHIPSKTGNHLSLETIRELASLDGLAGIKDSSKDIPWLGQAIDANPELSFLAGSDSLLFPGLEIGCTGLVSAIANVFPELILDLYTAYDTGSESRARRLQSTVYAVRTVLKQGPYLAGVKTALGLRDLGFDPGPLRDPLRTMDTTTRDQLADDLRELELL